MQGEESKLAVKVYEKWVEYIAIQSIQTIWQTDSEEHISYKICEVLDDFTSIYVGDIANNKNSSNSQVL